ncbi:MAG: helix-turn-helix domain-containing protein [Deltaproteobacteria bacterium]|nr:helix-turn-helix domain-containing protein [Deltaproteobacteria bacterium]
MEPDPLVRTFGKYARERIRQLGKSQKALAAALGVSPAYISQILTGRKHPPDLGRPRNRSQLRTWCETLEAPEEEVLDLVRFELHRLPPRPAPRFARMRNLLARYLGHDAGGLLGEIRSLELHPAESRAITALVQIFMILRQEWDQSDARAAERFMDLCGKAQCDREFVEGDLVSFFGENVFTWTWDAMAHDVHMISESALITDAVERIRNVFSDVCGLRYSQGIPVVGSVTAAEGFDYTVIANTSGHVREYIAAPPGVAPELAPLLYCVRVRGDSLREMFSDGALLLVKMGSWQEIKDGDVVIFKDASRGEAYVKKLEFAGDNAILKSKTPLCKDLVIHRSDTALLERVIAAVF